VAPGHECSEPVDAVLRIRMDITGKIGIVGSGLIGKSWAMIFASVGYKVNLISFLRARYLKPSVTADKMELKLFAIIQGNIYRL
jgi:hypothetical protein